MSDKSASTGKFVLAAVIVLAGMVPAGYVAFDFLRKELKSHQAETRSVVMDLQTQTVEEIRASAGKTADALKQMGAGGSQALADDVSALKRATEEILAEQKAISQGLSRLLDEEAGKAKAEVPTMEEADYSQSIYFDIGKSHGAAVDKQVAKIVPEIQKHLTAGPCQINVTGFADTLGNDINNLKLSRERADYVAQRLRVAKLEVYSVEAWGERRLKVHTYDGVNNEYNRRADIDVHCGKKPAKASAGT